MRWCGVCSHDTSRLTALSTNDAPPCAPRARCALTSPSRHAHALGSHDTSARRAGGRLDSRIDGRRGLVTRRGSQSTAVEREEERGAPSRRTIAPGVWPICARPLPFVEADSPLRGEPLTITTCTRRSRSHRAPEATRERATRSDPYSLSHTHHHTPSNTHECTWWSTHAHVRRPRGSRGSRHRGAARRGSPSVISHRGAARRGSPLWVMGGRGTRSAPPPDLIRDRPSRTRRRRGARGVPASVPPSSIDPRPMGGALARPTRRAGGLTWPWPRPSPP